MLITSRTPLRVSLFGGGTDYPEYFERHRGAVVGLTINKYVYVSALRLDSFIDYRYRVSYSKLEIAQAPEEIEHPVVREVLRHFQIGEALDINVIADLPARSGLGSSSAFTIGFLNLLSHLRGRRITKLDLAREAVFVERELLKERVGVQDQFHAAFGGINRFDFENGRVRITPVQMTGECQALLASSLVLVHTGTSRYASETLAEQIQATGEQKLDGELASFLELVDQAVYVLESRAPDEMLHEFASLLNRAWMTKRTLSSKISNSGIDALYTRALENGALGGKLCGAGSGGFFLLVVPPQDQVQLAAALAPAKLVPVDIDTQGSVILHG